MERLLKMNPIMSIGGPESAGALVPLSLAYDAASHSRVRSTTIQHRIDGEIVTSGRTWVEASSQLSGEFAIAASSSQGPVLRIAATAKRQSVFWTPGTWSRLSAS